jgi:hypothetical protein
VGTTSARAGRRRREIRRAITRKVLLGAFLAVLGTMLARELPSIKREIKILMM